MDHCILVLQHLSMHFIIKGYKRFSRTNSTERVRLLKQFFVFFLFSLNKTFALSLLCIASCIVCFQGVFNIHYPKSLLQSSIFHKFIFPQPCYLTVLSIGPTSYKRVLLRTYKCVHDIIIVIN